MTKRIPDTNGWIEIKDNPLSKVGVYPYPGRVIDQHGQFGLDPNEVYWVLRPEEELSDDKTLKSARLVPWINDHPPTLLGPEEEGKVPAEEKGVEGTTGEDIYFRNGIIYGNIKMFSESLADDVTNGKVQLSMGYTCQYVPKTGTWNGKPYQFVQRNIRFNHLASADSGRMGPDIAVLDANDLPRGKSMEETKETKTVDSPAEVIRQIMDLLKMLAPDMTPEQTADQEGLETPEKEEEQAEKLIEAAKQIDEAVSEIVEVAKEEEDAGIAEEDVIEEEELTGDEEEKAVVVEKVKGKGVGMDAISRAVRKQLAARDKMAAAVKPIIGTFDHYDMSATEVASYTCKKLGLTVTKGAEIATLMGYLQGRKPSRPVASGMDSTDTTSNVDAWIGGK